MSVIHGANYGTPTLDLNFAKNKSLIDTVSGRDYVTFTRSQTGREATYVGSDGLIKYASANEPRFDHNPLTGECLGLLIEEQRTNLATYSIDFSQAVWTKSSSTITANTAIAPDSTLTASLLLPNVGSSPGGEISRTGTNGIFSIYVKRQNARYCGFTSWGYFGGNVYFDLDTGNIVSGWGFHPNFGTVTPSIAPAGNGWYRISITATNESNRIFRIFPSATSGTSANNPPTGDGISGIYIWGAQLEAATFPTSYIPTTGSTVTRSADAASITGTNFSRWYNQSEGTVFANAKIGSDLSLINSCFISDATANNYIAFETNTAGTTLSFTINSTNIAQASILLSTPLSNTNVQMVGAYQANNFAAGINGGNVSTANSGTIPSVSQIEIGQRLGTRSWNSTISRFTYYPTRLQNYQLQQLTK